MCVKISRAASPTHGNLAGYQKPRKTPGERRRGVFGRSPLDTARRVTALAANGLVTAGPVLGARGGMQS